MIKKIITTTTLLAASAALANAACVAYTFNLENQISGTTGNIALTGKPDDPVSAETVVNTTTMSALGDSAQFTVSIDKGRIWEVGIDSTNLSTLAGNSYAQSILSNAGISSDNITSLTQGTQCGDANGTTTFKVTGLSASTNYTVTMLLSPTITGSGYKPTVSWDGGTLVSGEYAYGGSGKQTLATGATSFTLESLSAVSLTLTTDSSGAFNIKIKNNGDGQSNNGKAAIGLFAISDAIPEPSAFSLLAGLGAIALTVSRRRRKN